MVDSCLHVCACRSCGYGFVFLYWFWAALLWQRIDSLPRPMSNMLIIDYDRKTYENQPENTILVPKMNDFDEKDSTLYTILTLATSTSSFLSAPCVHAILATSRFVSRSLPGS